MKRIYPQKKSILKNKQKLHENRDFVLIHIVSSGPRIVPGIQ